MTNLTVKLENVNLEYKGISLSRLKSENKVIISTKAITDFNAIFEPETIYGFIGRNAAGKTSLLSMVSGYRKATSGNITINDQDIFDNSNYAKHINFIYQRDFSENYIKVKKFLLYSSMYRPYFDQDYCKELLKKFEINPNKRMNNLSKGQQSAVMVAVGLASRCPITIFDEAYLGMDAVVRNTFYKELLADQERHPRTTILSTHLITEVEYLFDKVIMIKDGKNLDHDYDPSDKMNLQDMFIELTEKGGE